MNRTILLQGWDSTWRKKMLRQWVTEPFWGVLVGYVGHYFLRYLPTPLTAKIGAGLGILAGTWKYKTANDRIIQNLTRLRPDLDEVDKRKMAVNLWKNLGQVMVEYSVFDKLHAENRVILEQTENLRPFMTTPRPVIFVTAHIGNWEICGNHVSAYGFDLMCIYNPVKNRFARRLADNARDRMGGVIKLVAADDPKAMRLVCKHLANNGAFWLAIDEYKNRIVSAPKLGRALELQDNNAMFAARLAQRFSAAIIPVLNLRHDGPRFTTRFDRPIFVGNGSAAIDDTLEELDKVLETWVMDNLEQWISLRLVRY